MFVDRRIARRGRLAYLAGLACIACTAPPSVDVTPTPADATPAPASQSHIAPPADATPAPASRSDGAPLVDPLPAPPVPTLPGQGTLVLQAAPRLCHHGTLLRLDLTHEAGLRRRIDLRVSRLDLALPPGAVEVSLAWSCFLNTTPGELEHTRTTVELRAGEATLVLIAKDAADQAVLSQPTSVASAPPWVHELHLHGPSLAGRWSLDDRATGASALSFALPPGALGFSLQVGSGEYRLTWEGSEPPRRWMVELHGPIAHDIGAAATSTTRGPSSVVELAPRPRPG